MDSGQPSFRQAYTYSISGLSSPGTGIPRISFRGPCGVLSWLKCSPILFAFVLSLERGMGQSKESLGGTWEYDHVVIREVVF